MLQTMLSLHNISRWLILLFGLWAILRAISGIAGKKNYTGLDNKLSLFFMICADIQLLIGLWLFFNNAWFDKMKAGMGAVMKNSFDRFFIVEHGFMMVLAWLLIHIGRSMVKRPAADASKHKKTLLWFGIAMLLILISIPWPFREAVAKPWLRMFGLI